MLDTGQREWGKYSPPRYSIAQRLRHMRLRVFLWIVRKSNFHMDGANRVSSMPKFLLEQIVREQARPDTKAYAYYSVFFDRIAEFDEVNGDAVEALHDVIEALRLEKNYVMSDRVRTIAGNLARVRGVHPKGAESGMFKDAARRFD